MIYASRVIALITGSIDSYSSRVSAHSRTRRASASLWSASVNRRMFGLSAGLSRTAMQSSKYAVCRRFLRLSRVLRWDTIIAIANANSCADNSRMTKLPTYAGSSAQFIGDFKINYVFHLGAWLMAVYRKWYGNHCPICAGAAA